MTFPSLSGTTCFSSAEGLTVLLQLFKLVFVYYFYTFFIRIRDELTIK